jgi:Uma2 family endonuclease
MIAGRRTNMATVLEPTTALQRDPFGARPVVNGEQRLVLYSNWPMYERFLAARGEEYPKLRITYSRGRLELMTISGPHGRLTYLLARLLDIITEELNIPQVCYGPSTIRREDVDRGMEPDQWYYFEHANQMAGIRELDFTRDPPPDLAIEIEVSRSILDRIDICRAIGIREVWRYDGRTLQVLLLHPDGSYAESPTSRVLPRLPLAQVAALVAEGAAAAVDDTALGHRFREWVRRTLLPTAPPQ